MKRAKFALLSGSLVAALGLEVQALPLIQSWSDSGSDVAITNGVTTQLENMKGYNGLPGAVVLFGEDVPAFTDRTHQYNGARFTAAGVLTNTNPPAAGDITVPLPSYLIGGEYMSTLNNNRDNPTYQMNVLVAEDVTAYLLIDNRVGETTTNATNPPTLGPGTNQMGWVLADGWTIMNTGISPNGQPDFGAIDEGATITDFNTRPTNLTNLGTGPGVLINNYFSIYSKNFSAGSTITLKEQNSGGINMYGLVVTRQVPEPASLLGLAGIATVGILRRRRTN